MTVLSYNPKVLWTSVKAYTGKTQYENSAASYTAQIGYNDYLRAGYERQLADWNYYVGSKGRSIRYPELSYAGKMRQVDTANTRANLDIATAGANYTRNLYGIAGSLYNPSGYISRYL